MAKTRWYNPLTWRMFGYNDPKTGDFVEVDMSVGGKQTQSGERMTPKKAVTVPIIWTCIKILSESVGGAFLRLCTSSKRGERQKGAARWSGASCGCCASPIPT